ncbi:betaine/proline/choline family ABC transporter ATP-binding protein [Salicibibacter cibarius]|uniref:Quaternary amine transport ATP-binding protein n=1 Tax=Salicibibacter cibarius TaxID=2743000 RepID=A0A7T6Z3N4_9BACI|nr:betaine/proline/choline family ABC transporter ATP-binding protein [Salicibibacter cibarius]QQK76122.1 betaine/proline/choline family ABC transporter ATP-binding protein [Salicibibacter cibarius]
MLKFENVSKTYKGNQYAVKNLSFEFDEGEFIVFIGPSGCGKTTTMKMINRLIDPTEGSILINSQNAQEKDAVKLRRDIGYVIQQIGLFPHMTIQENVTLVPKLMNWSKEQRKERAKELLELVDMGEEYLSRYPNELSGGQQQRIGVLRALAADPPLILMDEPFGALDPITRDTLQDEFKNLQQRLGKTIVFVTHDMDEALKLADRMVILRDGELVQMGTPDEILAAPANEFVEEFIGKDRLLQSRATVQTVEQLMNANPITISEGATTSEAVQIMREKRVDSLLVTNGNGTLKGYVDIEMIESNRKNTENISDILLSKLHTVNKDARVRDSISRILKIGVSFVPVVDGDIRLVGILTRASLVDLVYDSIWGVEEPAEDEQAAAIEESIL